MSEAIKAKEASGAYDKAVKTEAFAAALGRNLRELGKDGHFQVGFAPAFKRPPVDAPKARSAEENRAHRTQTVLEGFRIESVQRLPGNVGDIELLGFGPTDLVGAYTAAISLLDGTEALILVCVATAGSG